MEWAGVDSAKAFDPDLSDDEDEQIEKEREAELLHVTAKNFASEQSRLVAKLNRRMMVISEMKSAYLRDIVVMKEIMRSVLQGTERETALDMWQAALPSIDLKQALTLHAPANSHMRVKPCAKCGGYLDIDFHDNAKVEQIENTMKEYKKKHEQMRIAMVMEQSRYEKLENLYNETLRKHDLEKKVIYDEMKKINQSAAHFQSNNEIYEDQVAKWRETCLKLEEKNTALEQEMVSYAELKVVHAETLSTVAALQGEVEQVTTRAHKLEASVKEQLGKITALERSNAALETNAESLRGQLEFVKVDYDMMKSENNQLQVTLKQQMEITKGLVEKSGAGLQVQMPGPEVPPTDATRSGASPGNWNARADLLQMQLTKDEMLLVQSKMGEKERIIEDLQAAISKYDYDLTAANERISELEEELADLRNEMQETKQHDTVAELPAPKPSRAGPSRPLRSSRGRSFVLPTLDGFDLGVAAAAVASTQDEFPIVSKLRKSLDTIGTLIESSGHDVVANDADISFHVDNLLTKLTKKSDGTGESENKSRGKTLAELDGVWEEPEPTEGNDDDPNSGSNNQYGSLPLSRGRPQRGASILQSSNRRNALTSNALDALNNFQDGEIDNNEYGGDTRGSISSVTSGGSHHSYQSHHSHSEHTRSASIKTAEMVTDDVRSTIARYEQRSKYPPSLNDGGSKSRPVKAGSGSGSGAPARSSSVAYKPSESISMPEAREGASEEELALREAILCTLTATVGPMPAKKAISALAPVIALYGNLLTRAMSDVWEAVLQTQRNCDFYTKLWLVLEKMVDCQRPGVTPEKVGEVAKECTPLVMASINDKGVSAQMRAWQGSCGLSEEMVQEMEGIVLKSGDIMHKTYTEYFGTDEDFFVPKMDTACDSLRRMYNYEKSTVDELNRFFITLVKEWAESKSIFVDIDNIIDREKKAVKAVADQQANAIIAELSEVFSKLEAAREHIRQQTNQAEVANSELTVLRPLPAKLETAEQKIRDLLGKIKVVTAEQEKEIKAHGELRKYYHALGKQLEDTKQQVVVAVTAEQRAQETIKGLNQTIVAKDQHIHRVTKDLTTLQEENHQRLFALISIGTQTYPERKEMAIQTEFICPPLSLRTAARVANGTSKAQYPMVFSSFTESVPVENVASSSSIHSLAEVLAHTSSPKAEEASTALRSASTQSLRNELLLPDPAASVHSSQKLIQKVDRKLHEPKKSRRKKRSKHSNLYTIPSPMEVDHFEPFNDDLFEEEVTEFDDGISLLTTDSGGSNLHSGAISIASAATLRMPGSATGSVRAGPQVVMVPKENSSLAVLTAPASQDTILGGRPLLGIVNSASSPKGIPVEKGVSFVSQSMVFADPASGSNSVSSLSKSSHGPLLTPQGIPRPPIPLESALAAFRVGGLNGKGTPLKRSDHAMGMEMNGKSQGSDAHILASAGLVSPIVHRGTGPVTLPSLSAYGLSVSHGSVPHQKRR